MPIFCELSGLLMSCREYMRVTFHAISVCTTEHRVKAAVQLTNLLRLRRQTKVSTCHSDVGSFDPTPEMRRVSISYVVPMPCPCRIRPNEFCCFSSEYNGLDLVRHGNGTTSYMRLRISLSIPQHF